MQPRNRSVNRGGLEFSEKELPVRFLLVVLLAALFTADYRLRIVETSPSITIYEFAAYLIPAVFFLDSIISPRRASKVISEFIVDNRYIVLYFLWAFFAVIFAFFRLRPGGLAAYKDLFPSLITCFVFSVYLIDDGHWKVVLRVLLVGAAVNSILGISQGLFGGPYPIEMNMAVAYKMDISGQVLGAKVATGFFSHPNGFGLSLIPPGIIAFHVMIARLDLGRYWRAICFFLFPAIIGAIYFSQAKGAMVWLAIALVISLFPVSWGELRSWLGLSVVCGLIVSLTLVALEWSHSYHALVTMVSRFQLWQAAVLALMSVWDAFFIGSAQSEMYLKTWITSGGTFIYPNAHNGILNQAIFYGVPGMVLYILAIISALKKVAAVTPDSGATPIDVAIARVLLACVLGLVGEYFFEPTAEGVLMQAQFFMLLGMCFSIGARRRFEIHFSPLRLNR